MADRRGPPCWIQRVFQAALVLLCGLALQAGPRVVRVGVFPQNPAIFQDADGQARGFMVDILAEVAAREGWQLQFVPGTWQEGLDRARSGDLDLITNVARTPERQAFLEFGQEAAFTVWSVLFARPGLDVESILEVRDRRVAIMKGDRNGANFRKLCEDFKIACTYHEVGTFEDVLKAVASGQADLGVTTSTFGYARGGAYKVVRTPIVVSPFDVFYASGKGRNRDLLDRLDAYLKEGKARSDSPYHQAVGRWLHPGTDTGIPPWLWKAGAALLAILALSWGALWAFRRQVKRATREIRVLNRGLKQELAERERMEVLMLDVATGVGVASGPSLLLDLVRFLARTTEAEVAFVAEDRLEEGGGTARILALWRDGAPGEPFTYPLAGTPCERVARGELCVHPAGIRAAFPGDALLMEFGAEGYAGAPLADAGGRVLGHIAILNRAPLSHVTGIEPLLKIFAARAAGELERQKAEEGRSLLERQMQHAQKLESLGVLAGGIAHDFNNLLTAMLGNLNLAQLKLAPEAPAQPHLESLGLTIRRAAELTRQMLAYSGKGKFVVKPHDLSQVVREMIHLVEVSISKKVAIRLHLAEHLPPVEADAAQIQQVVLNLVINASDAIGDQEGTIRLSTGLAHLDRTYLDQVFQGQDLAEGAYVVLEVSDTGCGMSQEVQARIFEPFFTTKVTGRGLGLSATIGILKGHHAGMKIYSELGRGTTFKLLFPAAAQVAHQGTDPVAQDRPLPRTTVLLVDDEDLIREAGKALLEALGMEVCVAADGQEAVEVLKGRPERIGLVLMDLTMPRMDGREAFHALRRIQPNLPIILSSGYNEQESLQDFLGRGVAAFLPKPYTLDALRDALRGVLG